MSQQTWDDFFFGIIRVVESKSKDRVSKVGVVVVGPDNEIRSVGYNGFPRGVNDDVDVRHERPAKYMWTEHAERNAIYNAARVGTSLLGCRIYLNWWPCSDCARGIIQSGISEVVINGKDYAEKEAKWNERWKEQCDTAKTMLKEAGIIVRIAECPGTTE
jgi:dCMP deaminase